MRKEKILVVEDEEDIRELIHFHLFKEKYDVLETGNGIDVFELAKNEKPDLIILDIMLPGIDGLKLCEQLKTSLETKEIKIIFLSAKSAEEDIVTGLELGADDYVAKPFSPKILMARVKAALRKSTKQQLKQISYAGVTLDEGRRKATSEGLDLELTASEFHILKFLISSPGHVYTRGQIVTNIRGHNHAVTDRSVDTQLVSLRKKMGKKSKLIETVWGVGYRFKEDEV